MLYLTTLFLIGCLLFVTSSADDKNAPSGIHMLDGICMSKRTDRLVYRHKNNTNIYIAFDILKKGKVQVFSWDIYKASKGTFISPMKEETLPAVDFRKMVNRNHILGACAKERYKKFKTRLQRKMKKCQGTKKGKKKRIKHCKITDIISVFVRLKLRKVKFNRTEEEECDI